MSGTFDNTFDMGQASSYNPVFINMNGGTVPNAEPVFAAGLASGEAYLNIHSNQFGGGEIRGFLLPSSVPEPAGIIMLGTGVLGVVVYACRMRGRTRV
jgi:hypothetical protein